MVVMEKTVRRGLLPRRLLPALLLGLIAAASIWGMVFARPPLAVGLTSFDAFPLDSSVRLEWRTQTEVNTVAYLIKRSEGAGSPVWLQQLGTGGYILADGGPATGAVYVETDNTAVNGTTYTYILVEVEADSTEIELATVTVTAGEPTPTSTATATPSPTQIIINVSQATNTPTPPPQSVPASVSPTWTPAPTQPSSGVTAATATRLQATATTRATFAPVGTAIPTRVPAIPVTVTPAEDSVQLDLEPGTGEEGLPGGAEREAEQGVALAQAQATETNGYPGPAGTPTNGEDAPAYPVEPLATMEPLDAPAYPSIGNRSQPGEIPVIGEQIVGEANSNSATDDAGSAGTGRAVLWIGFIVASLIFAGAVAGSIFLFTRKRE